MYAIRSYYETTQSVKPEGMGKMMQGDKDLNTLGNEVLEKVHIVINSPLIPAAIFGLYSTRITSYNVCYTKLLRLV